MHVQLLSPPHTCNSDLHRVKKWQSRSVSVGWTWVNMNKTHINQ